MRRISVKDGNFNSQPHKEADRKGNFPKLGSSISTHSLTRRLTDDEQKILLKRSLFQLTASQGG